MREDVKGGDETSLTCDIPYKNLLKKCNYILNIISDNSIWWWPYKSCSKVSFILFKVLYKEPSYQRVLLMSPSVFFYVLYTTIYRVNTLN